ncbi:MAG: tRNA glutamyl-Q(34) synthetase GluQRS [Paracoccaceae bacterium]
MTFRTRFAPSPTGLMHLGHAYSALLAHDMAQAAAGEFLLRIEDTDSGRCKPEFEQAIFEDLRWLGLSWPTPVLRQSARLNDYDDAINNLIDKGICYPCSCSRRDIRDAVAAPQERRQPYTTLDGDLYPGTCRHRTMGDRNDNDAIRLNVAKAIARHPDIIGISFDETGPGNSGTHHLTNEKILLEIGDIVLARRDINAASYHLAVTVDDAAQSITNIVRGEDLFASTFVHLLLQTLLRLPTPVYHHHRLIRDNDGQRLAKRDQSRALQTFRNDGMTPQDIRNMVGL